MSSFAGVSVLADGELCPATSSMVGTTADCGYHLLVVHDYSRTKELERISSRPFMVGGHCWLIDYCPNGESQSCADFISFSLFLVHDDDEKRVDAKFGFSLVDELELHNPVYLSGDETCGFAGISWACRRFMRRDLLEQSVNLKDDSFTIRCDIMVVCNPKDDAVIGIGTKALPPLMSQHFDRLLQTEVGADVKFEVGDETLAAHRCVLAARSKVFMSQLFGPMKEGTTKTGVIRIKDMEAPVFRALLSFIYTDSFPGMEEDAMSQGQEKEEFEDEMLLQWLQNLFVAADRYDIQRLKFICERHLSEHIGLRSVMSTLALAEQHHCQGLKEACFKFIQFQPPSCLQTVMASSGWDHVYTTYPSVLKELFAKVIASKQGK